MNPIWLALIIPASVALGFIFGTTFIIAVLADVGRNGGSK